VPCLNYTKHGEINMIKTRNTEKTRDLSMKNGETVELNTKNLENMVV